MIHVVRCNYYEDIIYSNITLCGGSLGVHHMIQLEKITHSPNIVWCSKDPTTLPLGLKIVNQVYHGPDHKQGLDHVTKGARVNTMIIKCFWVFLSILIFLQGGIIIFVIKFQGDESLLHSRYD